MAHDDKHRHKKNGGRHDLAKEDINTAALEAEAQAMHDDDLDDEDSWGFDDLPEGMREYALQAKDYALRKMDENPAAALALAFGAGALVATMLGASRSGRKAVRKVVKALPKAIRKPMRKAMPV